LIFASDARTMASICSQKELAMSLTPHGLPRSVEAIVDQQLRAWRAKMASDQTRKEANPRVVTISREFGAGGARVAKVVADKLGFTLWDHAFVKHLAERAGADPAFVEALDERRRDLFDDVMSHSFLKVPISGTDYRRLLTRMVEEITEHGAAVIVGRGANFLMRPEQGLRVRIICPLKERIRRYAARELMSLPEAERVVQQKDMERMRFVRQLCDQDARDPLHYDLTVNTAALSEEQAGALIVDAYAERYGSADAAVRAEDLLHGSP
jgi:cytidylate kinase